jgi:predicted dehydrogenase
MDRMIHATWLALYLINATKVENITNIQKKYIQAKKKLIDWYIAFEWESGTEEKKIVKIGVEWSWGDRKLLKDQDIIEIVWENESIRVSYFRDKEKRKNYSVHINRNNLNITKTYIEKFPHDSFFYLIKNFLLEDEKIIRYMDFDFGVSQFKLINSLTNLDG